MSYLKFNVVGELKKASIGCKTEADPAVLLSLIVGDYLRLLKQKR